MKIVHYSTSLSRSAGGLHASVPGLARAQAKLGADVVVVGGADVHFEAGRHVWDGVRVDPIPFRFGPYGLDPKQWLALAGHRPDVLHIHGIWSAASVYGATIRSRAVVVSPRGMLDPWIRARRPLIKLAHATLFERPMLRRAHVHALTEAERRAVLAFAPEQEKRCFVLPNGIDAEASTETGQRAGVLYLGRLHEKKQVLELIHAWSGLPGTEQLTVAGWGDPEYERAVADGASRAENVTFVGALHGAVKADAFEAARYFILPSLSEGMPMAVLEALQHGAIPVITDGCNLPDLFRDDIAVRIAPDFSDLETVMTGLFALPEAELARRSQRARAYARRYLWDTIARAMLDRYATILASRDDQ